MTRAIINSALRLARKYADGGMTLQRTEPYPEKPEGYEFYGPSDEPIPEGSLTGTAEPQPTQPFVEPAADEYALQRQQAEALPDRPPTWMEPDLTTAQMGTDEVPYGYAVNDAGEVFNKETGETLQQTRRPSILPLTKTPEGRYEVAMPRALDIIGNMGGGWSVPRGAGEVVLGAGLKVPKAANAAERVHELSQIPRAEAETVMAENAGRGLSFPETEAFDRLRLNLERERKVAEGKPAVGEPQERTVIRAPEGLPDFVTGKLTPQDWIARHEAILSPEEIKEAAKWYDKIFDEFLKQTNGDVDKAQRYMRGWLVAQQNVDVSGAMGNVLLQAEQLKRGVPTEQMRAAGMPNPTGAARAVMQDKPISGGVGQKISDFVDAAEGKDVRSWMANHPAGGSPFVVDVHTGRDTGLVDQELINHLTRLGYNKDDLKLLKKDLAGTPSSPQYESRGKFGRDMTDYLNQINWQGRNNWKPAEVQAVGWMGMTKLTANKAEDVASGLSQNMRNISMELSPGEGSPWQQKFGERFSAIDPQDQFALTHSVTRSAIDEASRLAGIDVRNIVHGTGGWQTFQSPSTVGQAFATKEGAEIAANALGHMLQQTEVWANKVKPMTANPKGFAVDFIAGGEHNINTDAGLRDLWAKIMDADPRKGSKKPLFQGYQPIVTMDGEQGIRVLVDQGGVKTGQDIKGAISGPLGNMVKSLPYDMDIRLGEAEITKAVNNWKTSKNGQAYISSLRKSLGRDPTADLNSAGQKLEEQFRQGLEAAEAKRKAATAAGSSSVALGQAPVLGAAEGVYRLADKPFYSAIERAVTEAPQAKASPEQWGAMLRNKPGIKPEEMQWLGLDDWLKQQKGPVTKDQIADYVRANQIEVKEVHKGAESPVARQQRINRISAALEEAKQRAAVEPTLENLPEGYRLNDERASGFPGEAWSFRTPSSRSGIYGTREEAANHLLREAKQDAVSNLYRLEEKLENAKYHTEPISNTRHSSFQLPGGENYRELLLTLPERRSGPAQRLSEISNRVDEITKLPARETDPKTPQGQALVQEFDRLNAEKNKLLQETPRQEQFSPPASHFDEPNFAHVRFNDRKIGGKKTLFLEEVQSDWHQKGRLEGYATDVYQITNKKSGNISETFATRAEAEEYQKKLPDSLQKNTTVRVIKSGTGVPDAPFKTSWPELVMKRMIRYAAENGYDKVAWTPGSVQAERYDLSKHIDGITVVPVGTSKLDPDAKFVWHPEKRGGGMLGSLTTDLDGKVLRANSIFDDAIGKNISDVLGKDIAEKGLKAEKELKIEGADLSVGGEGMKGFYDQILPASVNKLVKKFGAKVGEGKIESGGVKRLNSQEEAEAARDYHDMSEERWDEMSSRERFQLINEYNKNKLRRTLGVHSLDITPQLKRVALEQGFPLFSKGPVTGAASGVQQQQERAKGGRTMPLIKSGSRAAISSNISDMVHAGHPRNQAIAAALSTARKYGKKNGGEVGAYARGGTPHYGGLIKSDVPGRTDKIPLNVKSGSYVIPADITSAIGQGNTDAGASKLEKQFKMGPYGSGATGAVHGSAFRMPPMKLGLQRTGLDMRPKGLKQSRLSQAGGERTNDDGHVPIIAAGGEMIIPPEVVMDLGNGNMEAGHKVLDKFVEITRSKHIKTLRKLPPPKK